MDENPYSTGSNRRKTLPRPKVPFLRAIRMFPCGCLVQPGEAKRRSVQSTASSLNWKNILLCYQLTDKATAMPHQRYVWQQSAGQNSGKHGWETWFTNSEKLCICCPTMACQRLKCARNAKKTKASCLLKFLHSKRREHEPDFSQIDDGDKTSARFDARENTTVVWLIYCGV